MRRIHKGIEEEAGTAEKQDALATGDEAGDHQKDETVHAHHGRDLLPAHPDPKRIVCVCTAAISRQYPAYGPVGEMGTARRRGHHLCSIEGQ